MNTRLARSSSRPLAPNVVEWEELPSLASAVLRRDVPSDSYELAAAFVAQARTKLQSQPSVAPVWVETEAGALEPLPPSEPLRDSELDGLATREIIEPEVFRHFFGVLRR